MTTINFSSFPDEIFVHICCYLSKNPEDLLTFGKTCKKISEVVNKQKFQSLLLAFQELKCLKDRLAELRGSNGFNGLVHLAHEKLQNAEKLKNHWAHKLESMSRSPCAPQTTHALDLSSKEVSDLYLKAVASSFEACREWNALRVELFNLALFTIDGQIFNGKISELSKRVESEIKLIQKDLT